MERFIKAQRDSYEIALAEIKAGRKRSHWIWYIFPQLKGLGSSGISEYYRLAGREEAEEYFNNPILRERLLEISGELLKQDGTANDILGYPDDLKVKSCMTLFSQVAPEEEVFKKVLDKFYDGALDEKTLGLL